MAEPLRADDQFARYYTEKLWELIPSVHRHEDGIAERPGTLRAFVELIAEQVAVMRRSHDRLWDDAFIDLCDDWAVSYLGDLVGTRMVSALNLRARRVDVAKTIYYRRRKGTPRVLEELIADITGWEGKVVESFRFLGRHRHRLDPALPDLLEPAVGWADLRLPRLTERVGGPWDPFAHTPDLRRARGDDGRWNIPRVSFHLFRLAAFRLSGVRPHLRAGNTTFTFDPSGRDIALYMPRRRGPDYAWDQWQSLQPWEVPAPMSCRVLGDLAHGKPALWPEAVEVKLAGTPVLRGRMSSANLANFAATAPGLDLLVDPLLGRGKLFAVPPPPADVEVSYTYGFGGQVGAGGYDRRGQIVLGPDRIVPAGGAFAAGQLAIDPVTNRVVGTTEFPDSATYTVTIDPIAVERLTIQAANRARPYVTLTDDWIFTAAPNIEATLILDGLWLGARVAAQIVLRGAWKRVVIRSTTLDPGGLDLDGAALHPIPILVEGQVDELHVASSILAGISVAPAGILDHLLIEDSIVHATGKAAIVLTPGMVTLRRVTILGAVDVERLDASEALITGPVDVTDTQVGCFRFGAAPPGSRLPHPYRWVRWDQSPAFVSERFGDPGYLWLSDAASDALRRGGENGTEIGVWNRELNPVKEDSLLRKVEEYLPFGLIPMFIRET